MVKQYFLSIGSNLDAESNVPRILQELLSLSPRLDMSRIVETSPVAIVEGDSFLNFALCFYSNRDLPEQKSRFNEIEAKLGRDRSDPNRKQKSRTADIDILFALDRNHERIEPELLPNEPYVRPTLLELLHFLNIDCYAKKPVLPDGVGVKLEDAMVGQTAMSIRKKSPTGPIEIVS